MHVIMNFDVLHLNTVRIFGQGKKSEEHLLTEKYVTAKKIHTFSSEALYISVFGIQLSNVK